MFLMLVRTGVDMKTTARLDKMLQTHTVDMQFLDTEGIWLPLGKTIVE